MPDVELEAEDGAGSANALPQRGSKPVVAVMLGPTGTAQVDGHFVRTLARVGCGAEGLGEHG
jgi:hypothetical protein